MKVKVKSLGLRLAILVALLGLSQAIGVLAFSYWTFDRELDKQKRLILVDKADHVRHLVSELADEAAISNNAFRLVELVTGHAELHLAVARPDAAVPLVAVSPEATESLIRLRNDTWESDAFLSWRVGGIGKPMLSMAASAETKNGHPFEVVLTIDRSDDGRVMGGLVVTALSAVPLALGIVFLSGIGIVKLGLRPLRRLREAASRVSANALSERLDLSGLPSELQSLGEAFNAMLERLDEGVRRLSEFSGDLSHEMRTPLGTLLGRTQFALSKERSTEDLVEVLESNVEELQRLTRLVADMLFLAQADNAETSLKLTKFDLALEARKVVEFLEVLAQERGVALTIEGVASVVADRSLVQRAITNVMANAIRYAVANSRVLVQVRPSTADVMLEVVNQGEPIASEHQGRLFDRFYRVDDARSRDAGGTGLGLAIVKAIMQIHGGRVEVSSSAGGETRFSLHFPALSLHHKWD
jgi:two-component system heavy metal sensor histidine kinase CusS